MVELIEKKLFANRQALVFVNRLSDLLYLMARVEHLAAGKFHEPV